LRAAPAHGQKGCVRVLVNAVHAKSGGGVTYVRNIVPALAAMGLELHLLGARGLAAAASPVEDEPPSGFIALLAWEQARVPAIHRRLGTDVVLSTANYGPLAIREQVLVLQNALAVGRRERRLGKRLYWAGLAAMTRASLACAREAIAVSTYAGSSAGARRAAIIPHGVSSVFAPLPERAREDFLLAVGDLYVQKNFHALLDALALLRPARPRLRLVIAGRPVDRDYAGALAARGGDSVDFVGHVEEGPLLELYRSCAAFVFPSTIESFGMPLLEAMACGAPIACSRAAAMPEIAGDTVAYFDPDDARDIAGAIARLLDDRGLAERLGAAAAVRARGFTWEEAARRTAAVLRRAAGTR
jgi:glycosyltransferase involved in cell wall biosynthesis